MDNNCSNTLQKQSKWLIFLSMIYLVGWTTTYLMVYKLVEIHHILETGAIFLFPLSYAIADIISDVYGYKIARLVIWSALMAGLLFCLFTLLITNLTPASFWQNQQSYDIVFSPILRVYFSLTAASIIGNFANIYFISKYKILMRGDKFWLRSLFSTAIGEFFFTAIGGTFAYLGIEPPEKIVYLMLDGYAFKMLYAIIAVWPASIFVNFLKKSEEIDTFDNGINYTPFSLKLD